MDIRKIGNVQAPELGRTDKAAGLKGGPSFEDALKGLQNIEGLQLKQTEGLQAPQNIKFSNHAVERMRSRGISFSPGDLQKLGSAVEKAASKGSQNSLVLLGDNALVVSVKNNTVVTVMDKSSMKENVFTNIDSTVVM